MTVRPCPRTTASGLLAVLVACALALVAAGCAAGAGADDPDPAAAGGSATTETATVGGEPARAGEPDAGAPRPSAGCDGGGAPTAGVSHEEMRSDGVARQYRRFVPASYRAGSPAPLVVDIHGLTMNDDLEAAVTGMEDLARTEGFLVATPQGLGVIPHWNYISSGLASDDVSYIENLVARMGDDLCVDMSRVYATGISNGGLMSSALACRLPDVFAAVAPVAGLAMLDGCDTGPPVPIQVTYGTADNVLPYRGGLGDLLRAFLGSNRLDPSAATPAEQAAEVDRIAFPPVDDSMAAWAARDGCAPTATEERVSDEVVRRSWPDCDGGTEVVLYLVEGGGHSWPGTALGGGSEDGQTADPAAGGLASVAGHTTQDISATELAWAFFQRHQLPN